MEVSVYGPNLSREGQAKGDMHVHAASCGDVKHYGRGRRFGGEDRGWTFEADSKREIVHEIYPPEEFQHDPDEWADLGVYFAPCVDELPDEPEPLTIQDLAREAAGHFETAIRGVGPVMDLEDFAEQVAAGQLDEPGEGERYTRTRDDSPEWVTDLIRKAHDGGELLPDDWRYSAIRSALDWIADLDHEPDHDAGEWADDQVDVYTSDRLAWLGSHSSRVGYCDQAQEEGLAASGGVLDLIAAGQYVEAQIVWSSVVDALTVELAGR